jgi:hypothetical protein
MMQHDVIRDMVYVVRTVVVIDVLLVYKVLHSAMVCPNVLHVLPFTVMTVI